MTNPTKIGRYEIIDRVGRGGMGVLYRGRDSVLEREVAIKVMSTDFDADSDDTARPRFYREARAAAKLQHRNIVTIFEFGEEDHTPFIVMEFLRGQDLSKRMRSEPSLTLEEKLDIVADLCTGLHFAHEQGVVHRDVKPANIWIQSDGSIKLLDFGIAKFASSTMTRQGSVLGSVSYMAPEQVAGGEVDGRADIFSAGVVLYELLAGKKPFEGDSPTAVLARIMDEHPAPMDTFGSEVPRPLLAALAKALQKDREKRYRHAADFGADLRLVRSALAAVDPATMDIELTRGMMPPTLAGPTLVIEPGNHDPAGAVSLVGAGASSSERAAPSALRPARQRPWLLPAVGVAVVFVAVMVYALASRSGPVPAPPAEANRAPVSSSSPTPGAAAAAPSREAGAAPAIEKAKQQAGPRVNPTGGRTSAQPGTPPVVTPPPTPPASGGAEVLVTGSYPFEVYGEGRLLSASGSEHHVRITGRQAITLREPEYFLEATFMVDPGMRQVRAPELGRLKLRFPESCSVVIGKRSLSEPPNAELPIAAGSYRILMSCADGSTRNYPATIRPGEVFQAFITK